MKLTPIFPAHIKPVRVGVYKTIHNEDIFTTRGFSYCNGKEWGVTCPTVEAAIYYKTMRSDFQDKRWQGVAHEQ